MSVPRILLFTIPPATVTYTLSLHDALPISRAVSTDIIEASAIAFLQVINRIALRKAQARLNPQTETEDRKSTRLNSSHMSISYAVFCLKKKKMTAWLMGYCVI